MLHVLFKHAFWSLGVLLKIQREEAQELICMKATVLHLNRLLPELKLLQKVQICPSFFYIPTRKLLPYHNTHWHEHWLACLELIRGDQYPWTHTDKLQWGGKQMYNRSIVSVRGVTQPSPTICTQANERGRTVCLVIDTNHPQTWPDTSGTHKYTSLHLFL